MLDFPPELVRNFGIIAHVDHGKSTLADRLLELTGTIPTSKTNKQVLDKLKVEKERGITVKAQTVSIVVPYKGQKYLLNLVDSPGHIDFSFEVERSLNAVQGALLIVDASRMLATVFIIGELLLYNKMQRVFKLRPTQCSITPYKET